MFNIQDSKAVFEEFFSGPSHTFIASLVPELSSLLENSQLELINNLHQIVIYSHLNSVRVVKAKCNNRK